MNVRTLGWQRPWHTDQSVIYLLYRTLVNMEARIFTATLKMCVEEFVYRNKIGCNAHATEGHWPEASATEWIIDRSHRHEHWTIYHQRVHLLRKLNFWNVLLPWAMYCQRSSQFPDKGDDSSIYCWYKISEMRLWTTPCVELLESLMPHFMMVCCPPINSFRVK